MGGLMIIGVPKEIKTEEFRVGVTPFGARELVDDGHTVLIETGAGVGSGFYDNEYERAGAAVVRKNELFRRAELVVKVTAAGE
jgi:alanine dehydrogenase